MPASSTTYLPHEAHAYLLAIGRENALAMSILIHLGIVQGGIIGGGTMPNCQVTRPDGSVQRFQIVKGVVKDRSGSTSHRQAHLSEPLNDALEEMFGRSSLVA